MNITKLEISGYKNLKVKLKQEGQVISLIGNNGSGKSNLLEAISIIFKNLYLNQDTKFDYFIEYSINNNIVVVTNNRHVITYSINGTNVNKLDEYLPKKVVAIYSGEANRLWEEGYKDFYDKAITSINNNTQVEMPKMMLVNKYYWHLSLLTLLLSETESDKNFVEQVLGIHTINKINIVINPSKYKNYKNNPVLKLAKRLANKTQYNLQEIKNILLSELNTTDIYAYLYLLFTPKDKKIIEDISIEFNNELSIDSLSEGEKKLLLLKAAFEFAIQEDSLFLLDEPDAHIHINNKQQIINLIEPFKHNRQVVLTTHSPTVTKCINSDELFMMDSGKLIDKRKQEIIEHLTGEFWNRHQQSSFLSSDKPIILLVEGKHDKTHITNAFAKLKDEYEGLEFDIFHMNGATNIEYIIKGLYTCELAHDKFYIGILDADEEGDNVCQNLCKETKKLEKFHAFTYPQKKIEGFQGTGFTVENLYDIDKYESAYKKVIDEFEFKPKSINNISDNIQKCTKAVLEENSTSFTKEDFKNFRYIFNKIQNIINASSSNIAQQNSQSINALENSSNNDIELSTNNIEVFYKDAKGLYNPKNHHLIIKAGSKVRKDYIPSFSEEEINNREALLAEMGFKEHADYHETLNDYEFNSPSGAGKFVFNSNVNGKEKWKNFEGVSLKELYPD